ncbi:DUF721 domain-containing protein [Alphaproteobacteria bacterium]|jgi:hypothetical protein|nr:DUF721 domain-containing protein [Alphaproteobacteria bacterium]
MLVYSVIGSSRPKPFILIHQQTIEPAQQIMVKPPKNRLNKMRRLSTMIEPMVAPSANERGFAISRLISHWHDIVGDTAAWCRPADIHFPRGSRNNGTLKLQIASGRGPQAQAMSAQIIDQVNAAFGYQAVGRITLVQNLPPSTPKTPPKKPATISDAPDIWTLDEKLKHIKSPELRAALRRLGGPVGEDEGAKN